MKNRYFITGVTGALGPYLVAAALKHPETQSVVGLVRGNKEDSLFQSIAQIDPDVDLQNVSLIEGDVHSLGPGIHKQHTGLLKHVTHVIHAAAITNFNVSSELATRTNVEGTRNVLDMASRLAELQRFSLISTACVSGTHTGSIEERIETSQPEFVNAYEESKWRAEQVLSDSPLPWRIIRLGTCAGDSTGYVHRYGALHTMIQLLERGLIPMIPAVAGAAVDLIPTNDAARAIIGISVDSKNDAPVYQVCSGDQAVEVQELVNLAIKSLRRHSAPWRSRQIEAPLIVEPKVYQQFQNAAETSGNAIYAEVMSSLASFLPVLEYPKRFQNENFLSVCGGWFPQTDTADLVDAVISHGCENLWRESPVSLHAAKEKSHV